jgi:trimeric autotransporter adhesin
MNSLRNLAPFRRGAIWFVVAFAILGIAHGVVLAQVGPAARPMVQGLVDDGVRVTLAGNVHPMARAQYDKGRAEDSFEAGRLTLILKRSNERELALRQYLQDAHMPGTASYHRWLTPDEFGQRFGAADSDVAAVTAWLESHGFRVNKVHAGRTAIEFSGNAAQVAEAFHTEIHRYDVRGEAQYANASDPQIPAAFAPLVAGIAPMHSFRAQPMIEVKGRTGYNKKTHVATPEWTYPDVGGGYTYELAPADFAVQYDLGPVYASGTTGTGQSIGILSASNVDLSLVQAYQSLFGLPANLPAVVVDGGDPGQNYAATEAYLDVEEAGAVAPGAKVVLYTSAGTVLSDPLLSAGLRALEDNVVSVISMSYGTCEAALGASGNAAWSALWQQAAAQGITGFVSAGDGGSAGCDDFNTQGFADFGLAVNGYGSTPYNVSVGGTDFYFSNYALGGSTLQTQLDSYWNPASTASPATSLLKPAPEQVWNGAFGLNATDGGVYHPALSTIVAGSGGVSSSAVYPASGPATGYPKPTWQAGTGVPADAVRDVPDVSLFASNGANYIYYPICAFPGDCMNTSSAGAVYITSVGGTSAAAPAMAAIQALVDQATNSRHGQADYVYYALATKTAAATVKPFNDIKTGGNQVPCDQGTRNCMLGTSGQTKGFYAESGYLATAGYDRASGLGTVDVATLIADWPMVTFKPSKTTLSITPAAFAHGTTVSVKATAIPASGTGTLTGNIVLNSTDAQAGANGLDVLTLSGGTVTSPIDNLPGGTYQVIANYSGNASYGPSASAPIQVTVTPEADALNTSGWVLNPVDDYIYPLVAGMSIPYGSQVYVDAQPVGVNEAKSTLVQSAPATGAVSFTDKVSTTTRTTPVALNSMGVAEWSSAALAVGSHTISAAYAGDGSYSASSAAAEAALTVFKGTTTIYVSPLETNVVAGSNVTVDVEMSSDYLPLNGILPTGSVSVTLGSQTITTPWVSWGTKGSATQEAVVTFTKVPAGLLPLRASYAGDINWNGSASLYGTITSMASKPAPKVTLAATTLSYTPTQIVTMTGTVTGSVGGPVPAGYLYFTWEDSSYYYYTLQKTSSNSAAWTLTFPANQLANGTNLFVATFNGDTNYSAQSSAPLAITLNGSDFSLTTTTPAVAVPVGKSGMGTVAIAPINGYTGTVAVSCSATTGITCSAATAAPLVGSGVSDAITFKVASTVAAGTYPAVVTASGGGHTHTAQILVAYIPPAATPAFSPGTGTYATTQTVTISDATPGAVLYYTIDGTTPTVSSAIYIAPIEVKTTETVKAMAMAKAYALSGVASVTYTITSSGNTYMPPAATPIFSPAAGAYSVEQIVTIRDATTGGAIYYTTDGSAPTTSSTRYTGAIRVRASETLKAVAIAAGDAMSLVASARYTIQLTSILHGPLRPLTR